MSSTPSISPFLNRGFTQAICPELRAKMKRAMENPAVCRKVQYEVLIPISERLLNRVLKEHLWKRTANAKEYRSLWKDIQRILANRPKLTKMGNVLDTLGARIVAASADRRLGLAMALHGRLGNKSGLGALSDELVQMIALYTEPTRMVRWRDLVK